LHIKDSVAIIRNILQQSRTRNLELWKSSAAEGVESLHLRNHDEAFILDTQTTKDLDLSTFFARFNFPATTYGEQMLWHRLHSQPKELSESVKIIDDVLYLQKNPEIQAQLQKLLKKVGKQHRGNITRELWDGTLYKPAFSRVIPFWFFTAPVLMVLGFLFFGSQGLFGLMILMAVNLGIFLISNRKINYFAGSMSYLTRGLQFFYVIQKKSDLKRFHPNWFSEKGLKRIRKRGVLFKSGIGGPQAQDLLSILIDYIRIFLCAELFAYYLVSKLIDRYRNDIRKIIPWIGHIDCMVHTAALYAGNPDMASPKVGEYAYMDFKNLRHPLVDNCIGQELKVEQGMIITGMNMAGKSTFLKTVSLNQILATSLGVVFADFFETGMFYVVSSLKIEDDISQRKSKYFLEAERLLDIHNSIKHKKLLCVVDEILTGTNTTDRITASLGILKKFAAYPQSLVIAATHDTQIAEDTGTLYKKYYFDGKVNDEEIDFDFIIKPGIVPQRNALALLEFLGLEIEVIDKTHR